MIESKFELFSDFGFTNSVQHILKTIAFMAEVSKYTKMLLKNILSCVVQVLVSISNFEQRKFISIKKVFFHISFYHYCDINIDNSLKSLKSSLDTNLSLLL